MQFFASLLCNSPTETRNNKNALKYGSELVTLNQRKQYFLFLNLLNHLELVGQNVGRMIWWLLMMESTLNKALRNIYPTTKHVE